jgi:hypothetical protein
MPDHIDYQAFNISYGKPVNKLVAPINILPIFHDTPPDRINLADKAGAANKKD